MDLPQQFYNNIEQADDVFETIALCYNMLLEYKGDADVQFIARAGQLSRDIEFGESAELFEELRQRLILSSIRIDMDVEADGTGFECFQSALIENLRLFQCPEKMDEHTCISLCMFYTIEALDIYINKNLDSVYSSFRSFGPLNNGISNNNSVVYLQERESFLSGAYEYGGRSFRKPLRDTRIGSIFHSVLLIKREEFCYAIPQIVPVFISDRFDPLFKQTRNLRIASIPYIGFQTFKFHEANSMKPCGDSQMPIGPFYIEYMDGDEEDVSRVINLLEVAIQNKANIIVFPEFIMSDSMLNAVRNYLREQPFEMKEHLLLVLAGTNYQINGRNSGDNVLHILNAGGYEVGCYYKHSAFLQQSEERFHGATLGTKKGQEHDAAYDDSQRRMYFNNCEILSHPGKECTIVDVEAVGRILPAICRDVIDGKYTERFADLFMPSILLVPAWSTSVTSFDSRFSVLADTLHITSLLCNCCNAVKGQGEKTIGKLVCPSKQGTSMKAVQLEVSRPLDCTNKCKENGGCIALIDIDFSQGGPTATQKVVFPCATA